MNFRSLTRGDGAVIGAAVLLLIASFLPYDTITVPGIGGSASGTSISSSLWHQGYLVDLATITLAGIGAAVLFALARLLGSGAAPLGLGLRQWGTALSVFAVWAALWSLFSGGGQYESHGAGAWLTFVFALVLAAGAVLSERNPALKAPLLPEPKPAGLQGYQQPFGPGQPGGGYGYPSGGPVPTFGGAPQQPGSPIGGHAPEAAAAAAPQAAQAEAPEFAPFWFAVPVARPLYPEDGSPAPVADLTPGTWYLAVDQRGPALVAQTQDGRRGVLQDTTGIQRG